MYPVLVTVQKSGIAMILLHNTLGYALEITANQSNVAISGELPVLIDSYL